MIPRATYRIQFHRDFPFEAGIPLAGYLKSLGISHLYASPIGTARSGSTHGYDVVDPTVINPELGGEEGFRALAAALKAEGLGIILDIVPNHMAVGAADNRWWMDVLEHGPGSDYARFFDIDWEPTDPAMHGKLLAPFLGMAYGEALRSGALTLEADGSAVMAHGTHRFPIRREDRAALASEGDLATRYDGRTAEGAERLHALLERQHYRLAWWRTAGDEINWRRFFDITELAGLRVEEPAVFDAVHALPLRLYGEGLIDGVRVDHVDGLADPGGYCRRLRAALDAQREGSAYLIVEKILAAGEPLPTDWRTDGTSGYDFMNQVAGLLHDPAGEAPLTRHWHELSGRAADFAEEEHAARIEILERTFPGQLDAVAAAFHQIARADLATRDVTLGMIRRALAAILVQFTAYRSYGGQSLDNRLVRAATAAKEAVPPSETAVIDILVGWMQGPDARDATRRFEQLSAPLAAKSVEDTAFYRYGRLLSRTDVGFDADRFSLSPAEFAATVAARAADYPHAMLTTATHDHKRGEDVRARLAVLSEMPDAWIETATRWAELSIAEGIDAGDCYQVLQTLVGACPFVLDDPESFAERVVQWSQKALREAKLRSSWTLPGEAYEARVAAFIQNFLKSTELRGELTDFVARIAPAGAVNGIVQAVLRSTLPGVPDCYQGADFWDLSLVDPDNRRPVDYTARQGGTSGDWRTGKVKQTAIAECLAAKSTGAAFTPVEATGARAGNIFAFQVNDLLVVVPIRCAEAVRPDLSFDAAWWGNTEVNGFRVDQMLADKPYALIR
ncbi:malto-oligosyltrehalose synthase [Sphingomonas xinjiangensis]|uniref:(1->4)-alpha-D-glucan 1-alpha-D-glucosylmutase n=1 Tax=Sphingomonas xinjiangensis TaxID=643568 RepID=A0A840YJ22_9SPHN|nr:malto-oligosyltrehalose synthase [Sphingomonas xinjiangensis]MBB5710928.1 (1->4)-alpha-D-glucan 1-alpha-D-glucosylmutase [Sphingomonas xinjiangensis]